MKIFLDASALVPMVVQRDQWALPLRRHLRLLSDNRARLITSNWTYFEALSIVRRFHHRFAVRLRDLLEAQAQIVPVSAETEAEALRRFFAWSDKTASVIDHANLLTAASSGCAAILSFDDDFTPIAAGAGIRVLR